MSFSIELAKKQFQLNLVISVDGVFYSAHAVDSGLAVDANKIGLVDKKKVKINPVKVDLRNVRTTVQSLDFELLDKGEVVTNQISASATQLQEKEVILYVGFVTGSFDFADYSIYSRGRIKKITRTQNGYSFDAHENVDLMNKDIFTTFNILEGTINASATTLTLEDATSFPTSGKIKIDEEFISYSGKTVNDLTGLSRGDLSSTAASHDDEAQVFLVTDTGSVNPIDFILDVLKSPDNGTLAEGLNIAPSLIDETAFTTIKSNNFASDLFKFFLVNVGNGLKFLEEELLQPLNCRFFPKDGKISIAILDQIDLTATVPGINENTTVRVPSWEIESNRLTNKIIVQWNFSEGLDKFTRTDTFTDTDSIATYGERDALEFEFKGLRAGIGTPSTFLNSFSNRLLERLSTPRAEIQVTTQFDKSDLNIGDDILLTHRYVPQQGGGLGISEQLEILSKSVNFSRAETKYDLAYTSYAGLRLGIIAPSPLISSVTNQKTFTVPDGTCFLAGFFLRLWDDTTQSYFSDPVNEIASVVGNTITMVNDFTTTLTTSVRIRFADYPDTNSVQKARHAFVGPDAGTFVSDGTKIYQINF